MELMDRIVKKIRFEGDGCWVWQGWKRNGYGRIDINRKKFNVHRVTYEMLVGPIPKGLQIDHLCRNRACCNPGHMEPVTQQENLRRGKRTLVTHCPQGHPYDEKNTRMRIRRRTAKSGRQYTSTDRECRACRRHSRRAPTAL